VVVHKISNQLKERGNENESDEAIRGIG